MALKISNNDCIQCEICRTECPNGAIYEGENGFTIDPLLCTECVGYYDEPRCASGCPTFGIALDPENIESREELNQKYLLIVEMMNSP